MRFPTVWFCWFLIININIHTICLSMNSAMFFVVAEGLPYLLWSANPVPFVQQKIQHVTVCLVVTMPSFASSLTICTDACLAATVAPLSLSRKHSNGEVYLQALGN